MKTLILLAVAALIVGGIYHTEVSQYFADLTSGSSSSGGGTSYVGSIRNTGNASSGLMGGVGNSMGQ